jgi:hypothetical protein
VSADRPGRLDPAGAGGGAGRLRVSGWWSGGATRLRAVPRVAEGVFGWWLGPLTLVPLLAGQPLAWSLPAAQRQFASLLGFLLYGACTGLADAAFHGRHPRRLPGALLRGLLAGALVALVLQVRGDPAVGPLIGIAQALEAPQPPRGIGAALIRGQDRAGGPAARRPDRARVPPVLALCAAGLGLSVFYGILFRRLDLNLREARGGRRHGHGSEGCAADPAAHRCDDPTVGLQLLLVEFLVAGEVVGEAVVGIARAAHHWTVTLPCIICRWYLHQNT